MKNDAKMVKNLVNGGLEGEVLAAVAHQGYEQLDYCADYRKNVSQR